MLVFFIILLLIIVVIQKATINGLKIWITEHHCIIPTKREQSDYTKKAIDNWINKFKGDD